MMQRTSKQLFASSRVVRVGRKNSVITPAVLRSFARDYATTDKTIIKPLGSDRTVENNLQTETNRLEKTLSKFWEKVGIEETPEGFAVQLDGKTIKTPLGYKLVIPKSKKTLANLVANEWKHIPSLSIKSHSLPLTSLVSRAIDLINARNSDDIEAISKVGKLEDIQEDLLRYLDTDTLLVFSPKSDCDGELRPAQEKLYRPFIKTMEQYLLRKANSEPIQLKSLDCDVGFMANFQSEQVKEVARDWMSQLDIWEVVALEKATLTGKSFLSGVAIIRMHDKSVAMEEHEILELEDIARAVTLETIYQTERWGEVEDTHDVDKVDVRRNLASASLLVYNA